MQVLQAPLGIQSSLWGNGKPLGQARPLLQPLLRLHQQFMPLVSTKRLTLTLPTPLIQPSRFLQIDYQPLNESSFEFPGIELEPFQAPLENERADEGQELLSPEQFLPEQFLPEPSSIKPKFSATTKPAKVSASKITSSDSLESPNPLKDNLSKGKRTKSSSELPDTQARSRRSKTSRGIEEIQLDKSLPFETDYTQPISDLEREKPEYEDSASLVSSEDSLNPDLSGQEPNFPNALQRASNLVSDIKSIPVAADNQIYTEENFIESDIETSHPPKFHSKEKENKRNKKQKTGRKPTPSKIDRKVQQKTDSKKRSSNKTAISSDQVPEQRGARSRKFSKTESKRSKQRIPDSTVLDLDQLTENTSSITTPSITTPDEVLISDQPIEDIPALSASSNLINRGETNKIELNLQHNNLRANDDQTPLIKSSPIEQDRLDNVRTSQIVFEQFPFRSKSNEVIQKIAASGLSPQGFSVGGSVTISHSPVKPIDPSDTVPAMLAPGEFVVNVENAQKYLPLLHHINQGGSLKTAPVPVEKTETPPEREALADLSSLVNSSDSSPEIVTESASVQRKQIKGSPNSSSLVSTHTLVEDHQDLSSLKPLQSSTFDDFSSDSNSSQISYSSPSLVFRSKLPPSSTSSSPSSSSSSSSFEWSSVEDLLGMDSEATTHSTLPSAVANPVVSQQPVWQGFAQGGEVTTPPIETAIETATATETIISSSATEENTAEKSREAIETLAQEIYSRLQQRLLIERERQGFYSGRLPW